MILIKQTCQISGQRSTSDNIGFAAMLADEYILSFFQGGSHIAKHLRDITNKLK